MSKHGLGIFEARISILYRACRHGILGPGENTASANVAGLVHLRKVSPALITGAECVCLLDDCSMTSVFFRLTVSPNLRDGLANRPKSCRAESCVCVPPKRNRLQKAGHELLQIKRWFELVVYAD